MYKKVHAWRILFLVNRDISIRISEKIRIEISVSRFLDMRIENFLAVGDVDFSIIKNFKIKFHLDSPLDML